LGPEDLSRALAGLSLIPDSNLLVGRERADDAGVYKISDDTALVLTLDFFTPIVDDPATFGQVAAANALSDVYAMGGQPLTAMNIVCFPVTEMPIAVLQQILKGGLDKLQEAGVALVGGHSIDDKETKYGLSITGIIHPDEIITNQGAQPGDLLILTKPLGTGIVNTALKGGMASEKAVAKSIEIMSTLNKSASQIMTQFPVHAATDITGFGLIGHAAEMIQDSDLGMIIFSRNIPFIEETREYAELGLIPGGLHRNRNFRRNMVSLGKNVPLWMDDLVHDPQTSGGLFIACPPDSATILLGELHHAGIKDATIVGEVTRDSRNMIIVE